MRKVKLILLLIILLILWHPWTAAGRQYSRVLFIHDSVGKGTGASGINKAFPALVSGELGIPYTLLGADGIGIDGVVSSWERFNYAAYEADLIVLAVGLNNVGDMPADEFRTKYATFLEDLQATGADVVACTMFHAVKPWRSNYDEYELFNQVIREEATARGIPVCDLWFVTMDYAPYLSQPEDIQAFPPFRGDLFHPNDLGHIVMTAEILRAIGREYYVPLLINQEIDR